MARPSSGSAGSSASATVQAAAEINKRKAQSELDKPRRIVIENLVRLM
jgi:hypothetical protein